MKVETVPVGSLALYPGNARRSNVELIKQSLQRRGQYKPLVVSADGVVLVGNHTLQAARQLGWETVAVVRSELQSASAEAKEILLADNRIPELGGYDDSALVQLLESLEDLEATGFTDDDLSDLLVGLEHVPLDIDMDDQIPDQGDENHVGKNLIGNKGSMDDWKNKGTRIVLFDLPLAQFVWAQGHLKQICETAGVQTNKDAFLWMIAQHAGEDVPQPPVVAEPSVVVLDPSGAVA